MEKQADWLLDAAPLRWVFSEARVTAPFEPCLTAARLDFVKGVLHNADFAYFVSYAGVIFDLSIGFLLMLRRARIFGMILMVMFHATNHFVIYDNIDWFPLVGVTTALVFLDADWPSGFGDRCGTLECPSQIGFGSPLEPSCFQLSALRWAGS